MAIIPEFQNIYSILVEFLGEAKNGFDGEHGQLQFPCPHCIETKGALEINKFNLEVNLFKGVYQCWACASTDEGMSGPLVKLIRQYGNDKLVKLYKDNIESLRSSSLYKIELEKQGIELGSESIKKQEIDFPYAFTPFTKDGSIPYEISQYIKQRGLNSEILTRFNMGYTRVCKKPQGLWSFRIILPSYNEYGDLNYCVGRDYTDKARMKYYNTKADKKEIIFNEDKVQWDADITLVEGPFDHIVVPNSIPLLGKHLDIDYKIYQSLMTRANANVNIFLDGDAYQDAKAIYKLLNQGKLYGKVRYIPVRDELDPSLLYQLGGGKIICEHLRCARQIEEIYL